MTSSYSSTGKRRKPLEYSAEELIELTSWRGCTVSVTPGGQIHVSAPAAGVAFTVAPDDAMAIARTLGQSINALAEDPYYQHLINHERGYGDE